MLLNNGRFTLISNLPLWISLPGSCLDSGIKDANWLLASTNWPSGIFFLAPIVFKKSFELYLPILKIRKFHIKIWVLSITWKEKPGCLAAQDPMPINRVWAGPDLFGLLMCPFLTTVFCCLPSTALCSLPAFCSYLILQLLCSRLF